MANEEYRRGFSLPQSFYLSEHRFETELDLVKETQWLLVDHTSRIPSPGDYVLFEFGNESIIVIRDKGDQIRAHYNVCRHRGSRICQQEEGTVRHLLCPYHRWSWEATGKLRSAPMMPADFDKNDHDLVPCHLRIFHDMIFVNLSKEEPPDFQGFASRFDAVFRTHGVGRGKLAHRQRFVAEANWKLVYENWCECYHCDAIHPTLKAIHDLKTASAVWAGESSDDGSRQMAVSTTPLHQDHSGFRDGPESKFFQGCWRTKIGFNHQTGAIGGELVAPPMGISEDSGCDGGFTECSLSPFLNIQVYPDHHIVLRFIPRQPLETHVEVEWYVHRDATAGKDYDLKKLTHMYRTLMTEDIGVLANQQAGLASHAYSPGRLSVDEERVAEFDDWYVRHFANL